MTKEIVCYCPELDLLFIINKGYYSGIYVGYDLENLDIEEYLYIVQGYYDYIQLGEL